MAVTGKAQFLRVHKDDITYHRWQSRWVDRNVLWSDATWAFQPFDADGIVAGDVESESSLVVGMPVTSITLPAMRDAMRLGQLVEITQYAFDPQMGNDGPQAEQLLVAIYTGEVVGIRGTFTRIEVELGSALAPVGIQVPPRTMTSQLIGVPCQL